MSLRVLTAVLVLHAAHTSAQESPDPCLAATAAESRMPVGTLPAPLLAQQKAYRAAWAAACTGAAGAPTVAALYAQAGAFAAAYETWLSGVDPGEQMDALQAFLTGLPSFVPAIESNFAEGVFVRVRGADFRKLAERKGEGDDKAALDALLRTRGDSPWPAWIQMTWDLGGCTRFGEHDWVAALSAADAVRHRVPAWKAPLDSAVTDMLADVAPAKLEDICTCGPVTAVAADLAKLDAYLAKTPAYAPVRTRVQALAAAVKSGKVKVRSEAVAHCSGG